MPDISRAVFIFILLYLTLTSDVTGQMTSREQRVADRAMRRLTHTEDLFIGWHHVGDIKIDSITANSDENILYLWFSPSITHIPVRYSWMEGLRAQLTNRLGFRYRNYRVEILSRGRELSEFIPNYYRDSFIDTDHERFASASVERTIVTRADRGVFTGGLTGAHLALWPSHGYYYEAERDRWEWQRARLFGTIEDLYPFSYIRPYIIPMLENAGAYVFLPRERDLQPNEVIVDNDRSDGSSEVLISADGENQWEQISLGGFMAADTLFLGDNPFKLGTHLRIKAGPDQKASVIYIPDIPDEGEYAVYVSWAKAQGNISDVSYTLNHSGGSTEFSVDQTIGHGTWIYLGTFHFFKGTNATTGSLTVSGSSYNKGFITTDAVRFGGGMGNVVRGWKLSGRPRYMEAARYYLQFSGMPDSTVYSISRGLNDYNDDFMSRGEWVNYLTGAPMSVTGIPDPGSPGIPIDLVLAFHTDAGITPGDSIIGTLAIYSSESTDGQYYTGQSRMASRDLSDIVQTQIVEDLRQQVNWKWTRRGLWDRQYSEAWRPQVPAVLLELLSHQNLADMSYGLDPRFRFIVGRSVYKGILRYLAFEQGREAIIQPLPPVNLAIEKTGENSIRLSWSEQIDSNEHTASASSFMVYKRVENSGFDNGTAVLTDYMDIDLPESNTLYGFKVTAVNQGGESLPGEILSAALVPNDYKPVLVVNGFTRISGPAVFDEGEMAGIKWWHDHGVADRFDFSHTGVQYDFSRSSRWLDDDSPGWGASYADMEGKIIPGNSFDFPDLYGMTLRDAGYSFVSLSKEAFEKGGLDPGGYSAVMLIFGKQRGIPAWNQSSGKIYRVFTPGLMNALGEFMMQGANIFITGAYIGTDMVENGDSVAIDFAADSLGIRWMTDHACNSGMVLVTDQAPFPFPGELRFNNGFKPGIYTVEAPDGIEPVGDNSFRIYRYGNTGSSAGVLKDGRNRVITLGFPFETILSAEERLALMKSVMGFFETGGMPEHELKDSNISNL